MHMLVGAGRIDAASTPPNAEAGLARANWRASGATTPDEYRRYIGKGRALARRFQPVTIEEPSTEERVDPARHQEPLRVHHGVRILCGHRRGGAARCPLHRRPAVPDKRSI